MTVMTKTFGITHLATGKSPDLRRFQRISMSLWRPALAEEEEEQNLAKRMVRHNMNLIGATYIPNLIWK